MKTVTLDILDDKAMNPLKELESLKLVRIRRQTFTDEESKEDSIPKYNGAMTARNTRIGQRKKPKYPENAQFKLEIIKARRTIKEVARKIGVSREVLTNMVNGHYKGVEIAKKLKVELNIKD